MAAARQHIFIAGQPGVGKSTLVQRCLAELGKEGVSARGFYTEEVRAGGERVGFDVVTLDGRRGPLARVGAQAPRGIPAVGKYAVDLASFERLALPELAPQPGVRLYVVDEVGKMELLCPAFFPAVQRLLDAAPLVLGTLPAPRSGREIPQVEAVRRRPDVRVVSISRESRERERQAVLAELRRQMQLGGGSSRSGGSGGGGLLSGSPLLAERFLSVR